MLYLVRGSALLCQLQASPCHLKFRDPCGNPSKEAPKEVSMFAPLKLLQNKEEVTRKNRARFHFTHPHLVPSNSVWPVERELQDLVGQKGDSFQKK